MKPNPIFDLFFSRDDAREKNTGVPTKWASVPRSTIWNLGMGQRAFTLFTALLGFILILLAGLLVNTMINSERVSNQVVLDVEAQSRMQSLADLTRADALQVVNYGIRNAIEEYTQTPDNPYLYAQQSTTWDSVIHDFSTFFFGAENGSIIAGRIAANLHVIVQSGPRRVGGFTVSIQGGNENDLKAAIETVLAQTNSTGAGGTSGQTFLQVVKCTENTPPVECVGTFYVNLDFSRIDDVQYEKLPSIHVRDETTGRELVEPVIPRGAFRIYVPLRLFRALKYAHEIAQGSALASGGGLLSPAFHSHLGELGVGMCDEVDPAGEVVCGYRTKPFTLASLEMNAETQPPGVQGGNLCPSEQSGLGIFEQYFPTHVPLVCDSTAASLGFCALGANITYYNPQDASSRAAALTQLTQGIINSQVTVTLQNIPQTGDFELLTNEVDVRPTINSFITKDILFAGLTGLPFSQAKCSKLVNTNVTLRFEETNPNYIVVDSRAPLHYEVKIVDAFVANIHKNTCVSYCLAVDPNNPIGGLFVNPDPGMGVCPISACAEEGKYVLPPTPPAPPVSSGG